MYKLQIILPTETITGPAYKSLKTVVRHAKIELENVKEKVFPDGRIPRLGSFNNSRMYFFSPAWNGIRGTQSFNWTYDYTGNSKFEGEIKILEV